MLWACAITFPPTAVNSEALLKTQLRSCNTGAGPKLNARSTRTFQQYLPMKLQVPPRVYWGKTNKRKEALVPGVDTLPRGE